jgi:hypothetical protein
VFRHASPKHQQRDGNTLAARAERSLREAGVAKRNIHHESFAF